MRCLDQFESDGLACVDRHHQQKRLVFDDKDGAPWGSRDLIARDASRTSEPSSVPPVLEGKNQL
jgi:hypothetical protein